jgi:hypothetical protein
MTAPRKWAAVAITIGASMAALPAAAEADTSPPAPTPPGVAVCGSPATGTSPGTTPPTTDDSSGTTPPAPATGDLTAVPIPCIDAAGNVYVIYVITTTTTTTPISAPILNANGSITWIPGSPVNETGGTSTTTTLADPPASVGGAMSCTPISGTNSMVCSPVPLGTGYGATPCAAGLKLKCTMSVAGRAGKGTSKTSSKPRTLKASSKPHTTKPVGTSSRPLSRAQRKSPSTRNPTAGVMLCTSV